MQTQGPPQMPKYHPPFPHSTQQADILEIKSFDHGASNTLYYIFPVSSSAQCRSSPYCQV